MKGFVKLIAVLLVVCLLPVNAFAAGNVDDRLVEQAVPLDAAWKLGQAGPAAALAMGDNPFYENENNNSTARADRIYNDYTVSGTVSREDVDYFRFNLNTRSRVVITVLANYNTLGMAVYDSNGLNKGSDYNGDYQEGYYGYNLTGNLSAGYYFIRLEDKTTQNRSNAYRFYITIEPVATGSDLHGWRDINGSTYYYDYSGLRVTGWQKIEGNWYYFDPYGAMQTGWEKVDGKWYYMNEGGVMQSGWMKLDGKWYYLGSAMATGWHKVGGTWYYFSTGGVMQTGWKNVSGTWYYLGSNGAMRTGWQNINGTWYYLGSNGAMRTGWQKVGSYWYYLGTNGAMQTGWQKIGSYWYYLGSNGAMHTGWLKLGTTWYYLKSNGAMATGELKIGTTLYRFAANGRWLG